MLCFLKIIQRHSAKYVKRHRSDHFSRCCEMPHYVSGMQTDSKEFVAKENSRPLRIFSEGTICARAPRSARAWNPLLLFSKKMEGLQVRHLIIQNHSAKYKVPSKDSDQIDFHGAFKCLTM